MNSRVCDLAINDAHVVALHPMRDELICEQLNIGILAGKIQSIESKKIEADKTISANGLHLLPGAIDTQVHFRDPGFPEKETLASGTRAAIMGGVTSVFEMPNTKPPTLSAIDLADKMARALNKSWCNYAFYMGVSPQNVNRLAELETLPGVCGIKMFMGSSTGNLVVGPDDNMKLALRNGKRRMSVHAEDEDRLNERKKIALEPPGNVGLHPVWRDVESALVATKKILRYAREANRAVHILHVTTAEEVDFLSQNQDIATFEVTPQHLTFSAPECYEKLGTLAQMNPPIREARHREALWRAVESGLVSVLGSDHAPHTLNEKAAIYPNSPSGMTGVQTILPLMLHHAVNGKLSLQRVVELIAHNPAKIFGIQNKGQIRIGADADLVLVDLNTKKEVKNSWIQSQCGWSPYAGMTLDAWVKCTILMGQVAMRDEEIIGSPRGKPLEFAF